MGGIMYGKDFDPIRAGTQDKRYPEKCKVKNNTGPNASGWGGQFHADVSMGLKMASLHPDVFEMDFMKKEEITQARLLSNHLNICLWGDISIALMAGNMKLAKEIRAIQSR